MLMIFRYNIGAAELKGALDEYIKKSKCALQIKFTNIDFDETEQQMIRLSFRKI